MYRQDPALFDRFVVAEDWGGQVSKHLQTLLPIHGRFVIELGCGTGHYTRALAGEAGRYIATEPEGAMFQLAVGASSGEAQYCQTPGEELDIPSSSVDLVWASWVVANLPQKVRKAALAEASRVLKPASEGVWLVESHWHSEFMQLRGVDPERCPANALVQHGGFSVVTEFDSTIRFESEQEATLVIGGICGQEVAHRLRGRSELGHRVVVLRR